ncbi:MAG: TetR/AcrR family transcriptional regulator [Candidatus Rokubacteria bacterium]|nr:TetR/AcrR family transcriptional regulator [Candidatus Rokubacteria bacterium]
MSTTHTTPTTPRTRDSRATREAVIAAATKLMRLHGYHGTSLDDVLRESGVGKGNFYYYFKSKEELGYAILDQLVADFLARTLEPCFADPEGNPIAQVHCLLDRVLEAQRGRHCVGGCPFGNLACELSDVHEGFRGRLAGVFSTWRERLTRAVGDAQARGLVTADCAPAAVAHFLVASLEGAILMTKLTKDISVMEQCVAEMKRYLASYEVTA